MSIPWQAKLAAKLLLSRLPVDYSSWRRLGLFRHGAMLSPEYACGVFDRHFQRAHFARKRNGFVALELETGDSASSGLIARAHGARASWLIDTGDFACAGIEVYESMRRHLQVRGLDPQVVDGAKSVAELLARCASVTARAAWSLCEAFLMPRSISYGRTPCWNTSDPTSSYDPEGAASHPEKGRRVLPQG